MPTELTVEEIDKLLFPDENVTGKNYLNNAELYEVFVQYTEDKNHAIEAGLDKPPLPDPIAKAILDICHNLSYYASFINYTYKEDMVGDAIEVCVRYIDNFDPEKTKNPFSYITTIAYQAFVRRIKKEQRQHYYKLKSIQMSGGFAADESEEAEHDNTDSEMFVDAASQVSEYERKHKEKYEASKEEAITKKRKNNLEEFFQE